EARWQRMFFGRDRDRHEVASVLRSPATDGIVAIVGPSGCGKSSLMRAGVLPYLARQEDWHGVPPILPGARPREALAAELAAEGIRLGLDWNLARVREHLTDSGGLAELADQILVQASKTGRRRHLLVGIDQFEEVVLCEQSQRAQLARLLAAAMM